MQLVVDANILIAAFLKSAVTRELLLDNNIERFAPEYFVDEVTKTVNSPEFLKRCPNLIKSDVNELLNFLLTSIKTIPEEKYKSFIEIAKQEVPADDSPYLALSLALKIPIWSNDSAFQKQCLVKVYTTSDLIKLFREH